MFVVLNVIIVFWRKEGKDNGGRNEGVPHLFHGTSSHQALHSQGQLPTGVAGMRWEGRRGRDTSLSNTFRYSFDFWNHGHVLHNKRYQPVKKGEPGDGIWP